VKFLTLEFYRGLVIHLKISILFFQEKKNFIKASFFWTVFGSNFWKLYSRSGKSLQKHPRRFIYLFHEKIRPRKILNSLFSLTLMSSTIIGCCCSFSSNCFSYKYTKMKWSCQKQIEPSNMMFDPDILFYWV
jgi:hypothetical protein